MDLMKRILLIKLLNKEEMRAKLAAMGPMSGKELRTAFWVTLAIILWIVITIGFSIIYEFIPDKFWNETFQDFE